jgi:hypothetical protein
MWNNHVRKPPIRIQFNTPPDDGDKGSAKPCAFLKAPPQEKGDQPLHSIETVIAGKINEIDVPTLTRNQTVA